MEYELSGYGHLIGDRVRTGAYDQALRATVRPGSAVLDIGTGTGILALLACRLGARRVYAIETSDKIHLAQEIARSNGYSDRIEFLQERSTSVDLPERVDVIVSDLRGITPLFEQHIPSIVDARRRLLAPGGVMIPQVETLWAAVAEAPQTYNHYVFPWTAGAFGFDMGEAKRLELNRPSRAVIDEKQLLLPPQHWATLDYTSIENPNVMAEIAWIVPRAGTAHGIVVWFDSTLTEGVCFSNAPGAPETIYSQAFFPLLEPVLLAPGDQVTVRLGATLAGEGYVWRWNTLVQSEADPRRAKADFKQSDFFGSFVSAERLRKRAADYVPALSEEGMIDRLILDRMAEGMALGDIAKCLAESFPVRFGGPSEALRRAGELADKYSR
jgi:protein arginine N-methyltransferase 1